MLRGVHRVSGACAVVGFALLASAGCVSPILADEFDVATKLVPGQSQELVLLVLRDEAEVEVRGTLTRPSSGNWGEIIANDRVLGALLVGESRTGHKVEKSLRVERFWGFRGWEIYHLFFDEQDKLVGFYRKIL
jgi:hypothetical protein